MRGPMSIPSMSARTRGRSDRSFDASRPAPEAIDADAAMSRRWPESAAAIRAVIRLSWTFARRAEFCPRTRGPDRAARRKCAEECSRMFSRRSPSAKISWSVPMRRRGRRPRSVCPANERASCREPSGPQHLGRGGRRDAERLARGSRTSCVWIRSRRRHAAAAGARRAVDPRLPISPSCEGLAATSRGSHRPPSESADSRPRPRSPPRDRRVPAAKRVGGSAYRSRTRAFAISARR